MKIRLQVIVLSLAMLCSTLIAEHMQLTVTGSSQQNLFGKAP